MTVSTDYRTTTRVNAPADAVFDAVTRTEALAAWWSPVTGSGLTDGELRFPMVAEQPPLLVRVEEATRPTTVRWRVLECTFMEDWVGTQPAFTITPIDDGSCEFGLRAPRLERQARMQGHVQPQLGSLRRHEPPRAGPGRPWCSQSQPAGSRPPRRRRERLIPVARGLPESTMPSPGRRPLLGIIHNRCLRR